MFSLPVGEQPYQSVRQTQQAGSASFTQQLTSTSRQGDAVLTAAGRLDFTGRRADGTHTWKIPDGLPAKARDTLLGEVPGKGSAAASARIALAPETVHHRSGTAGYWLRYDLSRPVDGDDSIAWLHGTEAARLVLTAHGRTKPVLPSASDAVLEASKAVLTRHEATPGDCIDFNTGTRDTSLVVEVSCTGPHDARVFGQVPLTSGDYPGPEAAHRRASDTCRRAHGRAPAAWTEDNAEPGKYWSSGPTGSDWGDRQQRVATCYVVSR
ncbi:hypothetical protein ACWCXB_34815 [Streptomyces sp. NPDC001514]